MLTYIKIKIGIIIIWVKSMKKTFLVLCSVVSIGLVGGVYADESKIATKQKVVKEVSNDNVYTLFKLMKPVTITEKYYYIPMSTIGNALISTELGTLPEYVAECKLTITTEPKSQVLKINNVELYEKISLNAKIEYTISQYDLQKRCYKVINKSVKPNLRTLQINGGNVNNIQSVPFYRDDLEEGYALYFSSKLKQRDKLISQRWSITNFKFDNNNLEFDIKNEMCGFGMYNWKSHAIKENEAIILTDNSVLERVAGYSQMIDTKTGVIYSLENTEKKNVNNNVENITVGDAFVEDKNDTIDGDDFVEEKEEIISDDDFIEGKNDKPKKKLETVRSVLEKRFHSETARFIRYPKMNFNFNSKELSTDDELIKYKLKIETVKVIGLK